MASDATGTRRQFGEGPLSRGAAAIYTLLVVDLLFLLTAAPGLALLVLLDHDASNLPLAAVCALPLGPALSAALFALRRRRLDLADLRPASAFWRGYRLNGVDVLRLWVPFLAVLTVIGVNLSHAGTAGVPRWWRVLLVLVAVALTLWAVNALLIASLFAFRTIDVARLAGYFLVHRPGVALGNAGVLLAAAGVTLVSSEAVLMLAGSLIAAALLLTSRPMTAEVEQRFTA